MSNCKCKTISEAIEKINRLRLRWHRDNLRDVKNNTLRHFVRECDNDDIIQILKNAERNICQILHQIARQVLLG